METDPSDFIVSITRSLGRSSVVTPGAAPAVDQRVARLADPSADLVTLFRLRASDAKMKVIDASREALSFALRDELLARDCRRVVFSVAEPLRASVSNLAEASEIIATPWSQSTLDASYDVDAGITDVWRAVAETGSLVVRGSAEHGRAVSLVPPIHFAIVRKAQIVPDLIDLMGDVQREGSAAGIVLITGPSKTADIEMNLVTGVHGPGEVVIFLVD